MSKEVADAQVVDALHGSSYLDVLFRKKLLQTTGHGVVIQWKYSKP